MPLYYNEVIPGADTHLHEPGDKMSTQFSYTFNQLPV
jgi:hypothetical protein